MSNVPAPGKSPRERLPDLPGMAGAHPAPRPRPATPARHRSVDGTVVSETDAERLATAAREREIRAERARVEAAAAAATVPALSDTVATVDGNVAGDNVAVKVGGRRAAAAPWFVAGVSLFCCLVVSIILGVVLTRDSGSGDRCVRARSLARRCPRGPPPASLDEPCKPGSELIGADVMHVRARDQIIRVALPNVRPGRRPRSPIFLLRDFAPTPMRQQQAGPRGAGSRTHMHMAFKECTPSDLFRAQAGPNDQKGGNYSYPDAKDHLCHGSSGARTRGEPI